MPSNENLSRLFVKSYFAASAEEAIAAARTELGEDALLLNMKEAPPEAGRPGDLEVVFGVAPPAAHPPARSADRAADLRQCMKELRERVTRLNPPVPREKSENGGIASVLREAGIRRQLAAEIEAAVERRLRDTGVVQIGRRRSGGWAPEIMAHELQAELESRVLVAPELGHVTAFVGPPGSGKTSTLVKLAVTCGLLAARPVRLISIDCYRIAAADQLRTYAAILGVPFTLVETIQGLAHAIDAAPREALVLIDTPGYTAASLEESGQQLAAFLSGRQDIDTHLVLTATLRQSDAQRAASLFEVFRPAKLLFTHLDETDSMATVFCEVARTGKPLSCFASGQLIPEDLEPASAAKVASLLVQELPQPLEAVA